jgi:hypothetical protein
VPTIQRTLTEIRHDSLRHNLCPSVRTICVQSCALGDGDNRGDSINSGRGRIDDAGAIVFAHYLEQRSGSPDIVLIVGKRDLRRFSHSFISLQYKSQKKIEVEHNTNSYSNMNDTPNPALSISLKYSTDLIRLRQIALVS